MKPNYARLFPDFDATLLNRLRSGSGLSVQHTVRRALRAKTGMIKKKKNSCHGDVDNREDGETDGRTDGRMNEEFKYNVASVSRSPTKNTTKKAVM